MSVSYDVGFLSGAAVCGFLYGPFEEALANAYK
jgi:hypothetical protein